MTRLYQTEERELIDEENYIPLFMHLSLKAPVEEAAVRKEAFQTVYSGQVFLFSCGSLHYFKACALQQSLSPPPLPPLRLQLKGAATEAGFDGKNHLTSGTTGPF